MTLKQINFSELIEILHKICELSVLENTGNVSEWDFDLSLPYLKEMGLEEQIKFKVESRNFKRIPLNSERHIYDMYNIVLQRLQINLDSYPTWGKYENWHPLDITMWHFEYCNFIPSKPNSRIANFPWRGNFRFYKNVFGFESTGIIGFCLLNFQNRSRILFQGNDFQGNDIYTQCLSSKGDKSNTDEVCSGLGHISFIGNKGIKILNIQDGYSNVALTGTNIVGGLRIDSISDDEYDTKPSIYLGPRETIDSGYHYCFLHRNLFLSMKRIASLNYDTRQLNVLDKQLERIEYYMNKEQCSPSLTDWRVCMEYWQDRILYGWKRWSANFSKSWIRPLICLVGGYLLFNAVPVCFIDSFTASNWVEFTLRPLSRIAEYEELLHEIVGNEHYDVSLFQQSVFRIVGLFEVIWIAMWSFAFAKAIKR